MTSVREERPHEVGCRWLGREPLPLLWYLVVLTFRKFRGLSGVLDFLTPESER
jgi:hypothetical protein